MKKNEKWNVLCACGCGENVPRPKRKNKNGEYPKFIQNHWWKLPEFKNKISQSNKKRKKDIPDISPCVGRRFRGGKYYSRYLMEEKIGRKLSPDEFVHHINGNKADDRIENLMILKRSIHVTFHNRCSPVIRLVCCVCGKTFFRKEYIQKRNKRAFCSRYCFCNPNVKHEA